MQPGTTDFMAAVERRRVAGAPACLCVLCGLPAAGKSTLARRILNTASICGWRAVIVSYDDLIPEQVFVNKAVEGGKKVNEALTCWKNHRREVLQLIEQLLAKSDELAELPTSTLIDSSAWNRCIHASLQPEGSKSDDTPIVFVLDDNFYYPSMRYEVYQSARTNLLGFCQVHLQCDVECCISRNQSRTQPVPTEVILEMEKRLEPPNPMKNLWEQQSISLPSSDVSQTDIQKVMELISWALDNPLSPAEDNAEQKESDRLKCATSVVHQADQACRRLISATMKTAREHGVSPKRMQSLAAQLNTGKATFLQKLRKDFLQEACFLPEEDVDVDRLVRGAVENVFDAEKEDILSRFIISHR